LLLCVAAFGLRKGGQTTLCMVLGAVAAAGEFRREEEGQASLVEHCTEAIVANRLDGIVTVWNRAAERLFGYTKPEVLGRPISLLFPQEQAGHATEVLANIRAGRAVRPFETLWRRKDGTVMEVCVSVSPVFDAGGQLTGTSSIARDIGEEKRKRWALERSVLETSRLRDALDAQAIVAITDARGVIIYANENFTKISKYSREELVGQTHRIVKSGHHPAAFFTEMWKTISEGHVWKGEIQNQAKDGSRYWVDTTIVPFLSDRGQPVQYMAIRVDITQQKQAGEALRLRTAELERSNAALEEFAYVASHDLQEPLRGISGCIQLLRGRYQGRLDPDADEFIRHSVENVERMQQLILGLLEYSRVSRKGQTFALVDCNEAMTGALRNLETAIGESGARIEVSALPSVEGDRAQLTQLFQNLVGNAIKFRGREAPVVVVGASRLARGAWEFTVKDNGIGLEKRHAERIFGMFQRLHSRQLYPGTGIGLAICKCIVERHGGSIRVESELGKGATFRFTLSGKHKENPA
jgi:PAS domain S-box-containing protein